MFDMHMRRKVALSIWSASTSLFALTDAVRWTSFRRAIAPTSSPRPLSGAVRSPSSGASSWTVARVPARASRAVAFSRPASSAPSRSSCSPEKPRAAPSTSASVSVPSGRAAVPRASRRS
jgi:hypothetical protein